MSIRKEKEKEFFIQHMDVFKTIGESDPFFIIKTAFFQKGKFGRQVQFFESELGKEQDIYIEFYDNVTDDKGSIINIIPFTEDRQLFKCKYNPFYTEEYETKEGTSVKGEPYLLYTVPVSEMIAVLKDGTEITHALYEKRKTEITLKKEEEDLEFPKLQTSLFPDFEKGDFLNSKKSSDFDMDTKSSLSKEDVPISEMTLKDFAAIMMRSPISDKEWLNNLISPI